MYKLLTFRSRTNRWGIVLLTLGIACLLRFLLYPRLGMASSGIFVLPLIASAWFFGYPGLILMVLTGMSFNALTVILLYDVPWRSYSWDITLLGGCAGLLIGLIIIRMRRLTDDNARVIDEQVNAEKLRLQHTKFLTLLNDIVRAALEAEDLQTLLAMLTNRAGELFSADDCFITLWDESNHVAVPAAAYGSMSHNYSLVSVRPGERTLTSSSLEAGRPLVVEDTANTPYVDDDVAVPFPKLKSALGLPLISGEKKLGALILGYHHAHVFLQEEIDQGEIAARQISLAMMKVILLEETRRNLGQLAGLHAIAQSFTLQEDATRTFGMLTEIIASLVRAKICLIAIGEPGGSELQGQTGAFGLTDQRAESFHFPATAGLETWDFSTRQVFRADSLEEMPAVLREQASGLGMGSLLAAPLWDAGRSLMGILLVGNKSERFGNDELDLLAPLANQAAVVVENTRLLSTERRWAKELSVLNKLSEAANGARNEDELIEQATQLIGEQLYPDNFGIMLVDQEKNDLYLHSSYRMGVREAFTRIPIGTGITGSVAKTGKMRCIQDVRSEPEYINADERVLSELCVPLKVGEDLIGVINAEKVRLGAFTRDDENLMGIIAGQLAGAIQRLRTADAEYHQNMMLMRANALIRVLAQVGSRVAAAPDPEGVMKTLGEELAKIGLTCLVMLPRDDHTMSIAFTSLPKRIVDLFVRINKRSIEEMIIPAKKLLPEAIKDVSPLLVRSPIKTASKILPGLSTDAVERVLRKIGIHAEIPVCQLPLTSEGKLQGLLWLWGEGIKEGDLPTMSIFGNQVAIALQNSRLLTEVQRLAVMDHGTGIFNRRHFFQLAEHEFSRARRYKHPLTAIIVDVDNFKAFNDHYGHVIGDQVLYMVAQTLKNNLREGDILGRYGGEEFSILLPYSDTGIARVVAERLCSRVADAKVKTDTQTLCITVSVGLAELQPEMETLLALVELADQAMYAAKEAGGNRVDAR